MMRTKKTDAPRRFRRAFVVLAALMLLASGCSTTEANKKSDNKGDGIYGVSDNKDAQEEFEKAVEIYEKQGEQGKRKPRIAGCILPARCEYEQGGDECECQKCGHRSLQ
jgi:hypothetical protein